MSAENLSTVSHDEPPKHRRVNFITLSDSSRSKDSEQEEGEEKEAKVVSRSRKRPHPDNSSDRVTRPTSKLLLLLVIESKSSSISFIFHSAEKRNLVAKVQETNGNNFYKLRNLERTMLVRIVGEFLLNDFLDCAIFIILAYFSWDPAVRSSWIRFKWRGQFWIFTFRCSQTSGIEIVAGILSSKGFESPSG